MSKVIGLSTKAIVAVVIVLVAIVGIAAWLVTQPTAQPTTTPSPTPAETPSPPAPSPTTPTPTATPQKIKIRVIGPWSGKEMEYFMQVLDEYKKAHPEIEFEYTPVRSEDLAKTLPLQFEAKTTPADVIITSFGWLVAEMAKKGHVEDLSGLINKNEYVGGILDSVTVDGKVYAAPFTMWLKPGFWYRKSFFEKHGLSEPKTWDEFKALLDKIKGIEGVKKPIVTGDGVGWPISDVTEHFIIAIGGPQLQLDLIDGKIKFTDPQVRNVFENYLAPLIKGGYFSEPIEWTTAVELWWKGEYALYFMGTWITGMVENPNDLAFFPLPGAKGVVGGTDYIFVPKYAGNKEAVLEFVKWLATEGQVVHASTPAGKIPTWVKADPGRLWGPMQGVYKKVTDLGLSIVPDLDDSVGGDWQPLFWDQLKLLWVSPDQLNNVLETLTKEHPKLKGS
jgi:carbohydrate ABC transporter substrate-binding protein, CUT1 family (TC 3.A.1.1.-)